MEDRLTDIGLSLGHRGLRPVYTVATAYRRLPARPGQQLHDMGMVSGPENLKQAIILRLLTPRGELSELAHPEYGSRLHELIGQQNTETNRNLIKLFILESLRTEPRVEEVLEVTVVPAPGRLDSVRVLLRVKPAGANSDLTVGPFTLELEG